MNNYMSENIQNYLITKNLSISQFSIQAKVQITNVINCINTSSAKLKTVEKLVVVMNLDIDRLLLEKVNFERI